MALFPTFQCTAEGCLKEASHTPGTLPLEGAPATHFAGFPPAPPRSTERAREPFYPFLDPIPPSEGGVRKFRARDLIIHGPAHRSANGAAMPTDENNQDGYFFFNHPERGSYSAA